MNRTLLLAALAPMLLGNAAPSPEQVAKARTLLENDLVDYSAAKIRAMRLVERSSNRGDTVSICGEVNAPNRMGGMTGWQSVAIVLKDKYDYQRVESDLVRVTEYCGYTPELPPEDPSLTAALQPNPA